MTRHGRPGDDADEQAAVLEYRQQAHGISEAIVPIDDHSAYWQKGS